MIHPLHKSIENTESFYIAHYSFAMIIILNIFCWHEDKKPLKCILARFILNMGDV